MKTPFYFSLILFFLTGTLAWSQSTQTYYLEWSPQFDLASLQIEKTKDGVTVHSLSPEWDDLLKPYTIKSFEKAFPESQNPKIKALYRLELTQEIALSVFRKSNEIAGISKYGFPDLKSSYPNDFFDSIGNPDTALQLIRMPQTWEITKGDSTQVVMGLVDRGLDMNHEDLVGQVAGEIKLGNESKSDHGTGIAGILAGKTNNGKGLAAAGYNSKIWMVTGLYPLEEGLDTLSKVPGVRVINASWGFCNPSEKRLKKLKEIMEKVAERNVLVIASAGNGNAQPCKRDDGDRFNGYRYPASFAMDNVISVTSVGHKFPIGNHDKKYGNTAWRDTHANSPLQKNTSTHTHNDAVDITAPGHHLRFAQKGNTYQYSGSGTSEAAPYVTATAGLMFTVNPNLSAQEAKKILLETADDISYIPYNDPYAGQLGAGRLNAYRAVLTASCQTQPDSLRKIDLMIRSAEDDFGYEPYNGKNYGWNSPDIWIRKSNDGKLIQVDQSDKIAYNEKVSVYLRITNRSCKTSTGREEVTLFWGKSGEYMPWPEHWTGEKKYKNQAMGGSIKTIKIPVLNPGEEVVVEVPWKTPKLKKTNKMKLRKNRFYLSAHITGDESGLKEQKPMVDNVVLSNNFAWREIELKD